MCELVWCEYVHYVYGMKRRVPLVVFGLLVISLLPPLSPPSPSILLLLLRPTCPAITPWTRRAPSAHSWPAKSSSSSLSSWCASRDR